MVSAIASRNYKDLRREATALKEVVADLTLENRLLKKRMARPVRKWFRHTII
jgi:transposase